MVIQIIKPGLMVVCIAILAVLAGCTSPTVVTKTEFQTVKVPIIEVPAPPQVDKPDLAINKMSPADQTDPGLLSKAYVVTIKQLEDYADRLNLVIATYAKLAKQSPVTDPSPNK